MGRPRHPGQLYIAGVHGHGAERGGWLGGGKADVGGEESDGQDGGAGGVDGGRGVVVFAGWGVRERGGYRGGWGAVLLLVGGSGSVDGDGLMGNPVYRLYTLGH